MASPIDVPKPFEDNTIRGTRERMLGLLRGPGLTVAELAGALEVTGNAVRGHLAALERDRLVENRGTRRGVRKPSAIYGLTPTGQARFPKGYGQVMEALLTELRAKLTPLELTSFLRAVGRRLAGDPANPPAELAARLQAAAATLSRLGTVAAVEVTAHGFAIYCHDCPLSDVSTARTETCSIANAALSEVFGADLATRCAGGPRPACRFELVTTTVPRDPNSP